MERTSIMVPKEIKDRIQAIRDQAGFKNEWQVIEFLLEIDKHFESREISAFLKLREAMFDSFRNGKQLTIDEVRD